MVEDPVDEQQVLVRFVASRNLPKELKVAAGQMAIPASLNRFGLSQIINGLLGQEKVVPFDFVVKDRLVREPLRSLLAYLQISAELVLDVEYSLAVLPPKQESKQPQDDWVSTVCGLPAGGLLSGGYDGAVKLWSGDGKTFLGEFKAHTGRITSVVALPSSEQTSSLVITGGSDAAAKLWRLAPSAPSAAESDTTMAAQEIAEYRGHSDSVAAVALSPASTRFASCGWDGSMHVWETGASTVAAAEEAAEAGSDTKKRKGSSNGATVSNAPPALEVRESLLDLQGHKQCVSGAVWPEEGRLVSCSWDRSVRRWDVATGINHATLYHNKAVHCVAVPPGEGNGLAAFGGAESELRLWDPRSDGDAVAARSFAGHTSWITAVTWHPTSAHHLVTASQDTTLRLWDMRTSVPLHVLNDHTDKVLCAAWLDDARIASGGADNQLILHSVHLGSGL